MNLSPLHMSPEEKLAQSSQSTNSKLEELIRASSDRSLIQKLDEIKSANLNTNRYLKDMQPAMQRSGSAADFIDGFIQSIKGDKGDSGRDGRDGRNGIDGKLAINGKDGINGRDGLNGKDGSGGLNGLPGKDGTNGKDGSPDTPDQVVDKVNQSKKKIDPEKIKGLSDIFRSVDEIGKHPQGQNVGGNNALILLDSTGARISDYVTTIKFSTNITPTYSAGVVTLTASGGSGFTTLTATETPDGNRTVFTFAAASAQPSFIITDGVWQEATDQGGTINWTWNNGTKKATYTVPPTSGVKGIV